MTAGFFRLATAIALVSGCPSQHSLSVTDGSADASDDGSEGEECQDCVSVPPPENVDILLMIDNSGGMREDQASLIGEFPRLIDVLSRGDRSCDGWGQCQGVTSFPAVESLHIGVVSSDMGTGGYNIMGCGTGDRGFDFGDDGVLRTAGDAVSGCEPSYPTFVSFTPGAGVEVGRAAEQISCVAQLSWGCGFEQPLEAVLKAVTPSTSDITFLHGSTGHADGSNRGFLRDAGESLLAVVLLTNEDDCSVADPDLFNPASSQYPHTQSQLNLLCFNYSARAAHPIQRYVEGLLATRSRPELMSFAAITGIPVDAEGRGYDEILSDPRMVPQIDPAQPSILRPSCEGSSGYAFPPVRIVRTAQSLDAAGAHTSVHSICQDDFGPAMDAIIDQIADALR